jgi:hypothetical protein
MRKSRVKAIVPLLVSKSIKFDALRKFPDHVNCNVNTACIKMLTEVCGVSLSQEDKDKITKQTVRMVGEKMYR